MIRILIGPLLVLVFVSIAAVLTPSRPVGQEHPQSSSDTLSLRERHAARPFHATGAKRRQHAA